jgi:hypothetical protein
VEGEELNMGIDVVDFTGDLIRPGDKVAYRSKGGFHTGIVQSIHLEGRVRVKVRVKPDPRGSIEMRQWTPNWWQSPRISLDAKRVIVIG